MRTLAEKQLRGMAGKRERCWREKWFSHYLARVGVNGNYKSNVN